MKVSKRFRSSLILLLVVIMAVSLSACGGSKQSSSNENATASNSTTADQNVSTEGTQSTSAATEAPVVTEAPAQEEAWYDEGYFTAVHYLGSENTGMITLEFDATPNMEAFNSVIGFAAASATIASYSDMPVLVRFDPSGVFQARDGDNYTALTGVSYSANTTYHFRMAVNLGTKTYDVYVTPNGGAETMIAQNYAFRTDSPETSDLGKLCLVGTDGAHDQFKMTNFMINGAKPPENGWYDLGYFKAVYNLGDTNTGKVTAEFDATPLAEGFNSVIGFAGAAAAIAGYSDLPVLFRFDPSGVFQARDGENYTALTGVNYSKNTTYHFRLIVSFDTKTYDLYVTPQGGAETMIAQNYAFRTDAPETKDLGKLCLVGTDGTHDQFRLNNFEIK